MENVIILGSGIAGLTAAIYNARSELKPLVLSGPQEGGQLMWTTEVENYPGFPEGVTGPKLVSDAKKQAEKFGARFEYGIVTKVEQKNKTLIVTVDGKKTIETKSLIIATGASARWLEIPSEEKYKGRGVSACATCDGAFFKEKEVIVVGGGDVAMEEALFMTRFASKVTIVHRKDEFRASKPMQDRVLNNNSINIIWNKEVHEILGDGKLVTGVKLKDTKSDEITEFSCQGIFLAIGHVPNTKFLEGFVELDQKGYLKSDVNMHTNVKGVFAAGDVHDYIYRQAITAAGSGCKAALEVEKYLAGHE
ncbi:MAG: thioredoxin-disulfide reductase [Candidatus Woesearchaeota archaeon]